MISSFHPHSMCRKVERVTAKTGCTSCTKRTISFEGSGFHKETRLFQRVWTFWTYLNSKLFVCSKWTIKSHIINFQPFWLHLLFCTHFLIFWAIWPMKMKSSTNELWKGWNLAWYHHFTHIEDAKKLRGLRQKMDALRVQNGQSLSKYQGFIRKLVCYKGVSFFWTDLNSIVFLCTKCTIQSHIINFQPFLTSFVIFHAFTDFLSYKTLKL
jgi:hypothetical protein